MMTKFKVYLAVSSTSFKICKRLWARFSGYLLVVFLSSIAFQQLAFADTNDKKTKWSVLLITVDCLRPDHMSVYGYERDTTPHMKRFAEESLVFENAFATSAWTSPGIVSMLTGYYPPVHAQNGRYSFYDEEMASPLRVFEEAGYEVLGQAIKGPTYTNLGFERGLRKNGLERFIEEKSSDTQPFFAWIHTKETHLPYTPTEQNRSRWINPAQTSEGIEAVKKHYAIFRQDNAQVTFPHAANVTFTQEDAAVVRALYDGEVADIDQRLGRAIERMRETGLLDRTIVIISADHGEELLEHGWVGHASTSYDGKLYDELIRIPLLIRIPNQLITGRYDALVQSTDIMPTLFEFLGIDHTQVTPLMQGQSLVPVIEGKRASLRKQVFAETTRKGWTNPKSQMQDRVTMVRSRDRKLVRHGNGNQPRFEAYDLKTDPAEIHDVYSKATEQFEDLVNILAKWSEHNREVAASLVLPAAQKQFGSMIQELKSGDLVAAVDHWRNIAVMHNTWGLEQEPFYQFDPYRAKWKQIRLSAAQQLTPVLRCDAETGMWQQATSENTVTNKPWICK
jgi:arylsulfatase A-like enzyme